MLYFKPRPDVPGYIRTEQQPKYCDLMSGETTTPLRDKAVDDGWFDVQRGHLPGIQDMAAPAPDKESFLCRFS